MSNKIPRLSNDCRYCRADGLRSYELLDEPCSDHRGAQGERVEYVGIDVYNPSEWVQYVVGRQYSAYNAELCRAEVYDCTGYDPRSGFWMKGTETGRTTSVSERAIDRSFHLVLRR